MKGNGLLFTIVVVLLIAALVLPGCNKEPPVEADKLVIPSALTPVEVFNETANAGPRIGLWPYFQEKWSAEHMDPYAMPQGAAEEQFIKGFNAYLPESLYIKRDGKRAGYRPFGVVSYIAVLKYGDTESAKRSFINISEAQELQDSTYGGIALKNGTCSIPYWKGGAEYYWDEPNQPCYLIHSGCFVIYFFGREDVAKDMLDRIIVAFGVKE